MTTATNRWADPVTYTQLEQELQQINSDMKILNGKTSPGSMPNVTAEQLAQLIETVDGQLHDCLNGNISDPYLQSLMNNPTTYSQVSQLVNDFEGPVGGTAGGPSLLATAEEYNDGGQSINDFEMAVGIANGPNGDFGQIWADEQAAMRDF